MCFNFNLKNLKHINFFLANFYVVLILFEAKKSVDYIKDINKIMQPLYVN